MICCPAADAILAPPAVDVVRTEPEIGRFLVPSMCVLKTAIEAVVLTLALGRDLEAQALGVGGAQRSACLDAMVLDSDATIKAAPRVDSPVHELVSLGPARVDVVHHEAGRPEIGLGAEDLVLRARRVEVDAVVNA